MAVWQSRNGQLVEPCGRHEEFMEKIVTFNQIELPALPPGHRYVHDPKSERLMVERPQQ